MAQCMSGYAIYQSVSPAGGYSSQLEGASTSVRELADAHMKTAALLKFANEGMSDSWKGTAAESAKAHIEGMQKSIAQAGADNLEPAAKAINGESQDHNTLHTNIEEMPAEPEDAPWYDDINPWSDAQDDLNADWQAKNEKNISLYSQFSAQTASNTPPLEKSFPDIKTPSASGSTDAHADLIDANMTDYSGDSGSGTTSTSSTGTSNTGTGTNTGTGPGGIDGPGGTDGPGTHGPGTNGPGTNGPGTNGPGTNGPGTNGPGTNGPGTNGPGTNGPGTGGPGTSGPGTGSPTDEPSLPIGGTDASGYDDGFGGAGGFGAGSTGFGSNSNSSGGGAGGSAAALAAGGMMGGFAPGMGGAAGQEYNGRGFGSGSGFGNGAGAGAGAGGGAGSGGAGAGARSGMGNFGPSSGAAAEGAMGRGGAGNGMMGGPGAGRGKGEDDKEHSDDYYIESEMDVGLSETDEHGEKIVDPATGMAVPPPVIGE